MAIRKFDSGAIRDTDKEKLDYEAFNSPLVDLRYAEFMHKNRTLPDGTLRNGDNWQKGFPPQDTLKSLMRHLMDVRLHVRGVGERAKEDYQTALCAIIFNAKAMLYEDLK